MTKELPIEVRHDKSILLTRINASKHLKYPVYQEAIESFRAYYPDDACVDIISLDYLMLQKRFLEVLAAVDRLDRAVGGDPSLENLRVGNYLEMKDLPKAKAAALRCVEAEPSLINGYASLLTVAVEQRDNMAILQTLRSMRDRFGIAFQDLAKRPEYADFIRSPEYQEWLKDLKPKPAGAPKG